MPGSLLCKFASFTGVGAVATGVQYLVLIVLAEIGVMPALASGIGYVLSALLNYYLNYRYTFRSTRRHREALFRFFLIAFVGLCLNTVIMIVGVEYLHLHYIIAQIGATGIVLIWNFSIMALWAF